MHCGNGGVFAKLHVTRRRDIIAAMERMKTEQDRTDIPVNATGPVRITHRWRSVLAMYNPGTVDS